MTECLREPGYYWVRDTDDKHGWMVACWTVDEWESKWYVPGDGVGYDDDDWLEIGPKVEPPRWPVDLSWATSSS